MMKTMLWGSALSLACYSTPGSAVTCGVTATDHGFGNYEPLSGYAKTSTSYITVTCSGLLGVLVTISLSTGSGSYSQRTMHNGTVPLNYNLYKDTGYLTVWSNVNPSGVVSYTLQLPDLVPGNNQRTDTVYGRIPASQTSAVPGNYSDTIAVTVDYFGL